MSIPIRTIDAHEILDSRGNPTLRVIVELDDGHRGAACVPSGVSTGRYEAVELRDGDPKRYAGKGVLEAAFIVRTLIHDSLQGTGACEQEVIDHKLIELDGTENKSKLGANATLGVSMAVARAAAEASDVPLYEYLCSQSVYRHSAADDERHQRRAARGELVGLSRVHDRSPWRAHLQRSYPIRG